MLTQERNRLHAVCVEILKDIVKKRNLVLEDSFINHACVMTIPPKIELGDVAFSFFPLAKAFSLSPIDLARLFVEEFKTKNPQLHVISAGPYVNIFFDRKAFTERILHQIDKEKASYGSNSSFVGQKVMVEFSSPNANKPLHLGHMRNNILGESLSRILRACGADVCKVNLINNRGVHICKAMLAYERFYQGKIPADLGLKSDFFVGECYVAFHRYSQEHPEAEEEVQTMLRAWEEGDPDVKALWEKITHWAVEGIEETYKKTGISFDRYDYESETYLLGRQEVYRGLEKGVFKKKENGAIVLELPWHISPETGLPQEKYLLREDGTSIYLTQDLGNAISRHRDYPFDRLVYVVGNEQEYHFKVLFYALQLMGFEWAQQLYHLSYGMVLLPHGKMKSREGTVLDADLFIQEVQNTIYQGLIEKHGEFMSEELKKETALAIALGAIHYFLLDTSPTRDVLFDSEKSLSFSGNTGPYIQYVGVRIASILQRYESEISFYQNAQPHLELLELPEEWALVRHMASFPEILEEAAREYNPSLLTHWIYSLAKNFSQYYHDTAILQRDQAELSLTRLWLVRSISQVFENALKLLNITFLRKM